MLRFAAALVALALLATAFVAVISPRAPSPPPTAVPGWAGQPAPPPAERSGDAVAPPAGPAGVAAAPASPQALAPPEGAVTGALPRLLIPVQGVAAVDLRDTFDEARGGTRHEAIDIAAPRGTPVLAVDDGVVAKLFTSVPGGLTVYQFDGRSRLAYYYAHLDRYADGLREGAALRRGDLVGYVGSTGNASADAPHLHFAVFRLGPERQWWKGQAVNPYPALR